MFIFKQMSTLKSLTYFLFCSMQVKYILENCEEDMEFFNTWVEKGIIDRLNVYILYIASFCCCIYGIGVSLVTTAKFLISFLLPECS